MILKSVENGPLIWPTGEENGVTRTKKYVELSAAEKIQDDYDMKATYIILQGLLADIFSLVNHHRTEDLDTYDSDCDDISNAKVVLMDNIFNYGFDVISECMHTRSSSNQIVESSTILRRRNKKRSQQQVALTNVEIPVVTMANQPWIWLEKEPPRSILTWEDLVSKFINQFSPPSKTINLRNEFTNFQQRFVESLCEAWGLFKDLLRVCPHHSFTELHQLDTFYNAINLTDQDSLNALRVVVALNDVVKDLLRQNKTPTPASIKAVEDSCVTCGVPHPYFNCTATDGNTFKDNSQEYVSAAAVNYNQGNIGFHLQNGNQRRKDKVQPTYLESTAYVQPLKLSLPDFSSTRMTLELATRTFAHPARIAEDVFVQVGKFTFSADFIVVDYDFDPRVPLILGRPFLRTDFALVDVHGEKLILRDDRFLKVLEFKKSNHPSSGNTTPLSDSSPSFTPFETSDSILEDFTNELTLLDQIAPGKKDNNFDFEADLREIEFLLHQDPSTKSNIETVGPILEKITNGPSLAYLPLSGNDDDDIFDLKSDNDKWKKLLYNHIIESNDLLPQLLDNDLTLLKESSKSFKNASLSSSPFINEDKVFNLGILILGGTQILKDESKDKDLRDKDLILEDRNFLPISSDKKLLFFLELTVIETLLSFSSENKDKVFNPGILISNGVRSLILELSHRTYETFKIINIHPNIFNEGYQNPVYLKKAQRIKATLYDSIVISFKHVAMHVIDDEETLILEEESRSKMSAKEKDLEDIKQKFSNKPIDYVKLNKLYEDFGKRFASQEELSADEACLYHMLNASTKPSDTLPVKIESPKELPKVSLVNESLKKLKLHLAIFDKVVKIRTSPNSQTKGEWGFEHTKAVFNNEIIPFLKSLKDIFNVFDKDLLNEIMEVQTVFDQMDTAFQQSSVDKQCLENAKK
uniref:Reverse transcriptase domain-containing protein n=1 Tax=Tanacetum cinerariifolium TaxID=118510 RepID=A0A699H280_TANCI|nr:reverse transcriptase domain-containing protein [Tanacetum cinerariifolium]